MSSGKPFRDTYKAELEYEELTRQRFNGKPSVLELAEMEDPTGYLALYDRIIERGLEGKYEIYKGTRKEKKKIEGFTGEELLKGAMSSGIKIKQIYEKLGMSVAAFYNRRERGFTPEELEAIEKAIDEIIEEET